MLQRKNWSLQVVVGDALESGTWICTMADCTSTCLSSPSPSLTEWTVACASSPFSVWLTVQCTTERCWLSVLSCPAMKCASYFRDLKGHLGLVQLVWNRTWQMRFCACDFSVSRRHVNDAGCKHLVGSCPLVYISTHLCQCVVTLEKYFMSSNILVITFIFVANY